MKLIQAITAAGLLLLAGQAQAQRYLTVVGQGGGPLAPPNCSQSGCFQPYEQISYTAFLDTELALGTQGVDDFGHSFVISGNSSSRTFGFYLPGSPGVRTFTITRSDTGALTANVTFPYCQKVCYNEAFGLSAFGSASDSAPARLGVQASFSEGAVPLPEPGSWSMLVLGFLAAGAALRRDGTRRAVRPAAA